MNNRSEYWSWYYNYDDETLAQFMSLSAAEKLAWVEEYIEFLEKAMTPEAKRVFEKYRNGELEYPTEKA